MFDQNRDMSVSQLDEEDEIEMGQSVVSITLNVPSPTMSTRGRPA